MPLFRALAKNMAASYFGKKAPYGFVMEVTLLYVFILWSRLGYSTEVSQEQHLYTFFQSFFRYCVFPFILFILKKYVGFHS